MEKITTIGLDLAKTVFQVHGIDEAGGVVVRKQLRRGQMLMFFAGLPPCLIGMEACATAHYWARELTALGHEVRLMPPQYVKAYVKRNKNDAADAEAICEAVRRPSMRFVPVKTTEQQATLMLHRGRELLVRQRTMTVNALRGHLAELGVVAPQGLNKVAELIAIVRDCGDKRVPKEARPVLLTLAEQIEGLKVEIDSLELRIKAWHKSNSVSQRLASIPGLGRSSPVPSRQPLPILACSGAAASSRPGLVSCHGRTPRAAKPGWVGLANAAMAIFGTCW